MIIMAANCADNQHNDVCVQNGSTSNTAMKRMYTLKDCFVSLRKLTIVFNDVDGSYGVQVTRPHTGSSSSHNNNILNFDNFVIKDELHIVNDLLVDEDKVKKEVIDSEYMQLDDGCDNENTTQATHSSKGIYSASILQDNTSAATAISWDAIPIAKKETDVDKESQAISRTVAGKGSSKSSAHNKLHWCTFCNQLTGRITRHLERKHKREPNVADLLKLPRIEKRVGVRKFVREMDYWYSAMDPSQIILTREARGSTSRYLPCHGCGGYFSKCYLPRHGKLCKRADTKPYEEDINLLCRTVLKDYPELIDVVSKIQGENFLTVCNDDIILAVGDRLVKKYGSSYNKFAQERLRRIANFLRAYRKIDNSSVCMKDVLGITKYERLKEVVAHVSANFKKPSVALRVGEDLELCRATYYTLVLIEKNTAKQEELINLKFLFDSDWKDTIRCRARRKLAQMKILRRRSLLFQTSLKCCK